MLNFDRLTIDQIEHGPVPVYDLLLNSLFYPASGLDGGVVRDCNTMGRSLGIRSFVYCDYATGEQAFENEQASFKRYHVFASRRLVQSDLAPHGWNPILPPNLSMAEYIKNQSRLKSPFSTWTIYERDSDKDEEHGPFRFSLLYIGGEGIATYQALYWTQKIAPGALAIIQPGTGFGLNYTNFSDPNSHLAWVINNNPAGIPDYIYYGGNGSGYANFKWPGYQEQRIIDKYYGQEGEVRLYRKMLPTHP